ncbi:DUF664 domain-containing protein, partial [Kitasatospora sp. NPDC047058]|uniref:mycothiol transferase n=1 Tax=Kitasatospora sp. NPDC047058 TaxID=3155620 RepID=UPI0033F0B86D
MTSSLPEPDQQMSDPSELLLGYLDYYRSVIGAKVEGMSDTELRVSRLPSGWTLLELLKHLGHMEQRWLRWGFRAEPAGWARMSRRLRHSTGWDPARTYG